MGCAHVQVRPTAFPAAAVDTEGAAPADAVSSEELSAAQVRTVLKALCLSDMQTITLASGST